MKRSVLILAALTAFAAPATAQALERADGAHLIQARQDRSRGGDARRVSLSEVVRRLRATRQGDMLDANESRRGGRAVYVIVWEYPGGRIGRIYVDQQSGSVIGEE